MYMGTAFVVGGILTPCYVSAKLHLTSTEWSGGTVKCLLFFWFLQLKPKN